MKKHHIRQMTPEQVLQILRSPSVHVAPRILEASIHHVQCLLTEMLHIVNRQLRNAKRKADALLTEMDAATQTALEKEHSSAVETGADGSTRE